MKTVSFDSWQEKIFLVGMHWGVYGPVLLLYTFVPYYRSFLDVTFLSLGISPVDILLMLLCVFSILLFLMPVSPGALARSRVYKTYRAIAKVARAFFSGHLRPALNHDETVSLALFLVKFIFVPIMLKFFIENFTTVLVSQRVFSLSFHNNSPEFFFTMLYPALLGGLLLVDTTYFLVGYLVESKALHNEVRSVDTTFLGWFSALVCYPPLNGISEQFLGWYTGDFSDFGTVTLNLFMGGGGLLLMGFYVFASISLGWKCSNLTNRGIVSHGAYALVRHPAYASKNLVWWIMGLPFVVGALFAGGPVSFSDQLASGLIGDIFVRFAPLLSLLGWSSVYYIRALTEERHLMQDPEYQKYTQVVKYRFIPGLL